MPLDEVTRYTLNRLMQARKDLDHEYQQGRSGLHELGRIMAAGEILAFLHPRREVIDLINAAGDHDADPHLHLEHLGWTL